MREVGAGGVPRRNRGGTPVKATVEIPSGRRRENALDSEPDEDPDSTESLIGDVPLDELYGILKNKRRRLVLHYLLNAADHEGVLGTIATQIAAWENDIPVAEVDSTLRKRTYNTLQQTHLPKMDEVGLVEYDRYRGTISLAVSPRSLRAFLVTLPKTGDMGWRLFFGTGVALWLLLAANWVAVHVLELYSPGNARILTGLALLLVFVGILQVGRMLR